MLSSVLAKDDGWMCLASSTNLVVRKFVFMIGSVGVSSLSVFFGPSGGCLRLGTVSGCSPIGSGLASSCAFPLSMFRMVTVALSLVSGFVGLFFSSYSGGSTLSVLFGDSLIFGFAFRLCSLNGGFLWSVGSPSEDLIVVLISFVVGVTFFSSGPAFASSSRSGGLFASFGTFPKVVALTLFIVLSVLRLLATDLCPSVTAGLVSPSAVSGDSPVGVNFI